jgi:hypothetical protein
MTSPRNSLRGNGGSVERIARAIHDRWRDEQLATGKPAPPWGELDESRKNSSLQQARDIAGKLRSIGCEIAPLQDSNARDFTFTDEEVERLGIAEHDRWMQERLVDGWSLGDKDVVHKKSPYLVPFQDLPADIADYDRMFVRDIPALLASAGLQVIRAGGD